ncbi:MAG: hypothetical protein ACYSW0_01575 [Planctomycetota bacterium]
MKQRAQLKRIDIAIELFHDEFEKYPPSDAKDETGIDYCGAMKLCEVGKVLYPTATDAYVDPLDPRKGPYLPLDNANAYSLVDLYGEGNTGPFDPNHFVLCDVFKQVKLRGTRKKVGMPILYYKADTSKTAHDVNDPDNSENIYDYRDNHALLALGVPGRPGQKHPLYEDPKIFYEIPRNFENTARTRPSNADTFILLSAGPDGLYGTKDDIANYYFERKRE